MRVGGDYEDEMRELRRLSDRDVERLLSGEALGDARLDDVASHLRSLRAFGARVPGDEVAARHVAAAVAAARSRAGGAVLKGAAPPAPNVASRRSGFARRASVAVARVAAGTLALSGATAGLAYAGVDLPGQAAEKAFERVLGVELPHQTEEREGRDNAAGAGAVADRVHAVIEAWGDERRGCEFGQAVAAAARGDSSGGAAEDPCARAADDDAAAEGAKSKGEERSASGRGRAEEARAAGRAKAAAARERAAERAAEGKATGEQKSAEARANAARRSSAGGATGVQKSAEGNAKAAENKAEAEEKAGVGQSNKPEDPGKP